MLSLRLKAAAQSLRPHPRPVVPLYALAKPRQSLTLNDLPLEILWIIFMMLLESYKIEYQMDLVFSRPQLIEWLFKDTNDSLNPMMAARISLPMFSAAMRAAMPQIIMQIDQKSIQNALSSIATDKLNKSYGIYTHISLNLTIGGWKWKDFDWKGNENNTRRALETIESLRDITLFLRTLHLHIMFPFSPFRNFVREPVKSGWTYTEESTTDSIAHIIGRVRCLKLEQAELSWDGKVYEPIVSAMQPNAADHVAGTMVKMRDEAGRVYRV